MGLGERAAVLLGVGAGGVAQGDLDGGGAGVDLGGRAVLAAAGHVARQHAAVGGQGRVEVAEGLGRGGEQGEQSRLVLLGDALGFAVGGDCLGHLALAIGGEALALAFPERGVLGLERVALGLDRGEPQRGLVQLALGGRLGRLEVAQARGLLVVLLLQVAQERGPVFRVCHGGSFRAAHRRRLVVFLVCVVSGLVLGEGRLDKGPYGLEDVLPGVVHLRADERAQAAQVATQVDALHHGRGVAAGRLVEGADPVEIVGALGRRRQLAELQARPQAGHVLVGRVTRASKEDGLIARVVGRHERHHSPEKRSVGKRHAREAGADGLARLGVLGVEADGRREEAVLLLPDVRARRLEPLDQAPEPGAGAVLQSANPPLGRGTRGGDGPLGRLQLGSVLEIEGHLAAVDLGEVPRDLVEEGGGEGEGPRGVAAELADAGDLHPHGGVAVRCPGRELHQQMPRALLGPVAELDLEPPVDGVRERDAEAARAAALLGPSDGTGLVDVPDPQVEALDGHCVPTCRSAQLVPSNWQRTKFTLLAGNVTSVPAPAPPLTIA